MKGARLPDDLFLQVIQDVRIVANQYGPTYSQNECSMSHYTSAVCSPYLHHPSPITIEGLPANIHNTVLLSDPVSILHIHAR